MLGLIGDYCGKIQLNSDKVRQRYIIKTKWGLTLQRVVVLTFRYRQHVNIAEFILALRNFISCSIVSSKVVFM